jgi:hypothetical protein
MIPNSIESLTFAKVILALESGQDFPVMELCKLSTHDFDLAIDLLRDWRIEMQNMTKSLEFFKIHHSYEATTFDSLCFSDAIHWQG